MRAGGASGRARALRGIARGAEDRPPGKQVATPAHWHAAQGWRHLSPDAGAAAGVFTIISSRGARPRGRRARRTTDQVPRPRESGSSPVRNRIAIVQCRRIASCSRRLATSALESGLLIYYEHLALIAENADVLLIIARVGDRALTTARGGPSSARRGLSHDAHACQSLAVPGGGSVDTVIHVMQAAAGGHAVRGIMVHTLAGERR